MDENRFVRSFGEGQVLIVRMELTAEASLAAIRDRRRFGMADSRDDQNDRHDDQQLNEREAFLPKTHRC
jgi:hypothetical protein